MPHDYKLFDIFWFQNKLLQLTLIKHSMTHEKL